MQDLAYDLVDNAARLNYDMLPGNVVAVTNKFILDTLAALVAGAGAPGCAAVVDQLNDWGGKPESTVLIYGGKVPSAGAALANSMMAHALEFDDLHDEAIIHANAWVLPAALAVAELKGKTSGKELITAVAAGIDLTCRVCLGATGLLNSKKFGFFAGYFGAAIAAGKLLNLDKDRLHDAMGIAYSQCAGNAQSLVDGALVKRMQPGLGARGGVLSCLLARRGITGTRNIFEGQYGLFPIYGEGKYSRTRVIEGLGERFEGENLSVKPYPSCRSTNPAIEATITLVKKHNVAPEYVAEVTVRSTQRVLDMVGRPFEIRDDPQVDAQFSIPYTVAVAITRRDVFIGDFFEDRIRTDRKVLELSKKVRVVADQEPLGRGIVPCIVEVKTNNGTVYSQRVEVPRGDPRNPMSMDEIAIKFRRCAEFCARPLSRGNIEEAIEVTSRLETLEDISSLIRLFS